MAEAMGPRDEGGMVDGWGKCRVILWTESQLFGMNRPLYI